MPSAFDRFVVFLAQGCGLGWIRPGPGTWGSLGAVFLAGGLKWLLPVPLAYAGLVIAVSLVGVGLCGRAARLMNVKDPGSIVFDEIAAVLLIFILVPWIWWTAVAGFVLFRVFDIAKPWPVSAAERLPGGWGVMADDLVAGAIAAGILWGGMRLLAS